jgi:hypothetical protein
MNRPVQDLVRVLAEAGFTTIEGADNVLAAIAAESDGSTERLCSGFRVFPDGTHCAGCSDCDSNGKDQAR